MCKHFAYYNLLKSLGKGGYKAVTVSNETKKPPIRKLGGSVWHKKGAGVTAPPQQIIVRSGLYLKVLTGSRYHKYNKDAGNV
jgi:hypothetical protein